MRRPRAARVVRPQFRSASFWSPEEMDVHRWQIASRLEQLTRLLRPAQPS